ncbi:hypothetical protein Cs7R123_49290 [Catellatospora sp. TT07R-123]|uniref:DUF4132 domain-containing protein n=1 Tax=Catellatospora sp. TT07R-123 TaxID=2733863 RepID=UPI001B21863E|nr:DUF4132 domain-containing protein [Catellatospora sp. TT07R-123]GHJ47587.1 hypothetical protein Cs7R123_49290 [Catellatospora sp. TT07R-123]
MGHVEDATATGTLGAEQAGTVRGTGDAVGTADENSFTMPTGWRRSVLPRRGGVPVSRKRPDPEATAVAAKALDFHRNWVLPCLALDGSDRDLKQPATAYLDGAADAVPLGAAAVTAVIASRIGYQQSTTLPALADAWLIQRGLVFAAQAVCELNSLRCGDSSYIARDRPWQVRRLAAAQRPSGWLGGDLGALAARVRAAVAGASEAEYAAVVAALTESRELGIHQRMAVSFLVPSRTDWVDADCVEAVQVNTYLVGALVHSVGTPAQLESIIKHVPQWYPGGLPAILATAVDGLGPSAAVPLLGVWFDGDWGADAQRAVLSTLSELPTDEAMAALLDRIEHKYTPPVLQQAAARYPRRAMRMLAEHGGSTAGELLRVHVLGHPDLVDEVLPLVGAAAAQRITAIAAAAAAMAVAAPDALPPVLVSPPWTRARKIRKPVVIEGLTCPDEVSVVWLPGERENWATTSGWYASYSPGRGESWETVAAHIAEVGQGRAYRLDQIALFLSGPQALAEPLIERWRPDDLWDASEWLRGVIARFEAKAVPMGLDAVRRSAQQAVPALVPFASAPVAAVMADVLARLKSVRGSAQAWLSRHPDAAARALVPQALGKAGTARRQAEEALTALAAMGHRDAVTGAADGYGPAARAAIDDLLAADPLDALPAKMPVVPAWADPVLLAPVQVRGGAGALSPQAARHLLTMLAVSKPGEPYAGIALVRQACDQRSLAEFAWSLFSRWQSVGYPAKESWAMHALGVFGDDDTVRRLAPLIRTWPGEGGHSRAVTGLDVLAVIGSDTALMHLHGIAEKVKFSGLKDKARQKMSDVAAQLGLSAAQLADRLVPDFGLSADGSLLLDYGRRQFVVGFDEQLKPYVADPDGKRRKDLPKPGAADDPELAPAAYQRFGGLKKDVRTVAADNIRRLEQAMVTRRRWTGEEFGRLLVGHPLLWHIVRRLVWGRYDESGTLVGALRVAEDRSFADVEDETLVLPDDAIVGVAHPAELGGMLGAWAGVFADYEILQPFPQLGRETYGLSEQELAATVLTRFGEVTIPTGRVVGLERRGWRRGAPQDAGHQGWMERDVPGNRTVMVELDPGIAIGVIDMFPEQKLPRVWIHSPGDTRWWAERSTTTFDVLDPVTASELLRDLEEITR